MPQIATYLVFDGNCAQAMRFYEKALGGKIETMMTHAQSPMCDQMPAESRERIMHACLMLDGGMLMASDSMPGHPYDGIKGATVSVMYPTAEEAKKVFGVLSDGGNVLMPMQATFWAEAFGMVTDRFGTPWMVNGANKPVTV